MKILYLNINIKCDNLYNIFNLRNPQNFKFNATIRLYIHVL
jgi:hypothetical protein